MYKLLLLLQACNDEGRVEVYLYNPLAVPLKIDMLQLHVKYTGAGGGAGVGGVAAGAGGGGGGGPELIAPASTPSGEAEIIELGKSPWAFAYILHPRRYPPAALKDWHIACQVHGGVGGGGRGEQQQGEEQ